MRNGIKFQKLFIFGCLFFIALQVNAQGGFVLEDNKKRDRFSFELVNNLVVIPVEVNGTPLSFLLDTGVDKTIIFSLSSTDSLEVRNAERVKIMGLGNEDSFDAIKSYQNTVKIGRAIDDDHSIYLIFDTSLNFSSRMGLPIHGVIGYEYFKNFVVKTNYDRKKIVVHDASIYTKKPCRRCEVFPLSFRNNKPYIDANVYLDGKKKSAHLLLDSGSSDAIWLFEKGNSLNEDPMNYFNDFLGMGLSGSIYGKRSKFKKMELGNFEFNEVNVAFPADSAIVAAKSYKQRDGTLGGEILRRFTSIINYSEGTLNLRKNNQFSDPFFYNMSGLTLEHDGTKVFKSTRKQIADDSYGSKINISPTVSLSTINLAQIELVPKFKVVEVRENSPADFAGITVGSEILEIQGRPAHRWPLTEIINLFNSKPGKKINIVMIKDGVEMKTSFRLEKVL